MNDHELLKLILQTQQETKQDIQEIKEDVSGLKEDVSGLKEDVAVLKQDMSDVKDRVTVLEQDVSSLKQDVSFLKQDVSFLKQDVSFLKHDVSGIKQDVTAVDGKIAGTNLHLENVTDKNISIVAENHLNLVNKLNETVKFTDDDFYFRIRLNILEEHFYHLERDVRTLQNTQAA